VLVAAAFVPSAPVLVPEVAAGAAHELDDLREACDAAVEELLDADLDLLIVLGSAPRSGPYPADAAGSFAPYGVDVTIGGEGAVELPLSLTVGYWLLERCDWAGDTLTFGVAGDESSERCAALGAGLAERANRVGLVVVGDGSATRTPKAPGSFDERAEAFDAAVDEALADPSGTGLAGLDPTLAAELMADGRAAWQVAAGLAAASTSRMWDARLLRSEAPYGVHYAVATWSSADPVE
jgi:hypothetical protein